MEQEIRRESVLTKASFCVSIAALMVAAASAVISYTQSPLFLGARPVLTYFYKSENRGKQPEGNWGAEMTVVISNQSSFPARSVRVEIAPAQGKFRVETNLNHQIHKGVNHDQIVELDVVPAQSTVEFVVKEEMIESADESVRLFEIGGRRIGIQPWFLVPHVKSVYTEFGVVPCIKERCEIKNIFVEMRRLDDAKQPDKLNSEN